MALRKSDLNYCFAPVTVFVIAITASASVSAQEVKKSGSGICHCPGGPFYDRTMNFTAFDTIGACLASGGRHPQRGQGTCPIEPDPTNEPTAMLIPGRYDRTVFGGWSDEDGDCQNTRHERLIERSLEPVELTDTAVSPRQGAGTIRIRARAYTAASDLEIDHVVPLF